MLEGGNGLHITANNITLARNAITSNSEDTISLKSNDVLNIENNNFTHSNPLDLRFPTLGVRSITLSGTDLKRPKTGFLNAKVLETLLIDSCQMKLDNELAFDVDVQNLTFANSIVDTMNTGAFKAKVRAQVEIRDSIFEHCQEKSFYGIRPTKSSQMILKRNAFIKFEDGFLKLDEFIESRLSDFNLKISQIDLLKDCQCALAHEAITEDSIDKLAAFKNRISPQELEHSHAEHSDGHKEFEQLVQSEIR